MMMHRYLLLINALTVACAEAVEPQPGLMKSEFIYETAPFPSCHAATIAETPEGLVAAFFGGTRERDPDVCIWVCRNENGSWTAPTEAANGVGFATNRLPTWNPVLFQPANGPLMLFYKVGPSPATWWGMLKTSADHGKTWSEAQRLPDDLLGPIKNKPVQLSNGDILSPSSREGSGGWRIHFERSTDGGKTWTGSKSIRTEGIDSIQPSILLHPGGVLQALGRTRQGSIFQTWSSDAGVTWEPLTLTELPNPNSGTDAVTLQDGRHLLVYNHNPLNKGRKPLNVAISADGLHWSGALVIEDDFSKRDGYAYPSVIQSKDGLVHIVYTWDRKRIKHVVVDTRKLQVRPIVDGAWPGQTNSIGMELAGIPAGSFVMGDTHGDWDEQPTNRVTLTKPFSMSMDEVTLEQYQRFRPDHRLVTDGKATGISWNDAVAFCKWLSRKEGKPYRLPTEAEWEYACRAGTTNRFWSGEEPPSASEPNPWNLRGMHDQVMEWCSDWHGPYPEIERTNPVGPAEGLMKVVRGDKPDDDSRLKDEPGRTAPDYRSSPNRAGLPPAFGFKGKVVKVGPTTSGNEGSSELTSIPGAHHVGFRVVQAPEPESKPYEVATSFSRLFVKPVPPRDILQRAPQGPYFRKRFLLPIPPDTAPANARAAAGLHPALRGHNHSPAMEICPNGDLLLIIYTSNFEYEPGVSLMASRLRFGADEWDFPEPLFDTPDANDHAPLLFNDDGKLWFFWGWPKMRAGAYPFQWVTSDNSGADWSHVHFPQFLTDIGVHARQPINTAFRDRKGVLYVASDAAKASSVLWATSNEGNTWRDTGGRSAGRHTTYTQLKDGSILGFGGKSSEIEGYMPQALSRDGGKSWEVSKTPFPALGVNQRPSVLRLKSGRIVFAGDYQKRGNIAPEGIKNRGAYVAFSDDEGKIWEFKKLPGTQHHKKPELQSEPDTLGYTVLRQAPNGMIHLIATLNIPCLHFEFNEAWLTAGPDQPADLTASKAARVAPPGTKSAEWQEQRKDRTWSMQLADDGRILLNGKEQWRFADGTERYSATYVLGRKTGTESFWRAPGQPGWRREHNADGTITWTQYWANGQKRAESTWRNLKAEGVARLWDDSGKLLSEAQFKEGILTTP